MSPQDSSKPHQSQIYLHAVSFSLLLFFLLTYLPGCQNQNDQEKKTNEHSVLLIDSYPIPVFASADEQFKFTRSWFKDHREKQAALQAVVQLFPEARRQCGLASLDLAYNLLGKDHRLDQGENLKKVIKKYKTIVEEYAELPEIVAKAYWYLGWLHCDLLGETTRGIEYYRTLISKFPHVERSLASPIRWISIITPEDTSPQPPPPSAPNIPWSHLAALEIIRHAENQDIVWNAFRITQEKNSNLSTQGIGLKLILQREKVPEEAVQMAEQFLNKTTINSDLHNDIQVALKSQQPLINSERDEGDSNDK